MNVLKRINELRIERGWSVYRMALEAELPQSTIINMFNRETLPSITTLESICKAFGITLSEFFEAENDSESLDKKKFSKLYESLSPATRQAIYQLMETIANENK